MKDQPRLVIRSASEPGHLEGIDHQTTAHIFAERPAHELAAEQIDEHCQKQPTLICSDERDISNPHRVRCGHAEVATQQVRCNRQTMSAVRGRGPEATLAACPNAVPLHQPLHPLFAYADAPAAQLSPYPWPSVSARFSANTARM